MVASALMLIGLALLGVITASLAAAFNRWATEAEEEAGERHEATEADTLAALFRELRALRAEVAVLRQRQPVSDIAIDTSEVERDPTPN